MSKFKIQKTPLIIENLTVSYGDYLVLDQLCLSLEPAKVHGLVGLNGSGKTTLLNTLAGYKRQDSGTIRFAGTFETVDESSHKGVFPLKVTMDGHSTGDHLPRSCFSFLETENYFYSKITGREYMEIFRTPGGSASIDDWNGVFDLPLDELIDGYSSGMKKKLALMAVLRQGKPLVILDEPFNGLDIESSRILVHIIATLKERNHTVIVTSHILGSLTGICDYIHLLKNGRIAFSKEPGEFKNLEAEIFSEVDLEHETRLRNLIG
jgi:ABC-2 type transport system ATP-binding protein